MVTLLIQWGLMPVKIICKQCGVEFTVKPSKAAASKYCSIKCSNLGVRTGSFKECDWCGEKVWKFKYQNKNSQNFCSNECKISYQKKQPTAYKGNPYYDGNGYLMVVNKKRERVYEHRMVAEIALGRKLLSSEHVHHIDKVKDNNAPWNLLVLTNSDHQKLHAMENATENAGRWSKKYERCVCCGRTDLKHMGKGMCRNCHQSNYRKTKRGKHHGSKA